MTHLIDGLHVNVDQLKSIKEMVNKDRKTKVIFLPIYKSYADPLVLFYINYFQNLETGFTFGNYEDSPKIRSVDFILKKIGTFLIRRNPENSLSSKTVD